MMKMPDLIAEAEEARKGLYGDLSGVRSNSDPEPSEPRMSPVTMYVRNLSRQMGKTFYTANEVAIFLGVSVQAIRKYGKNQVCGKDVAPSFRAHQGKMTVYLYTEDDVDALRQYLGNRNGVVKLSDE